MIPNQMWKKSILFEIVNRDNPSSPVEAYTLTIPPESFEIEEPQRISKVATFGGEFIDDYGPDVLRIVISGNTGGSDVRETYVPAGLELTKPPPMSGRGAFFHFRDRLMRYKSNRQKSREYQKLEMIIYDLSTITSDPIPPTIEGLAEGYLVVLDKFKMTRNKDKPLFYNYTIELTGIRPLGTFRGEAPIRALVKDPRSIIMNIRKGLNTVQTYFTKIKNIRDQVENVFDLVDDVTDQISSFFEQTFDILTFPTSFCKMLLSSMKHIVDAVDGVGEDWIATQGEIEEDYYEIIVLAKSLVQSCASLVTFSKNPESAGREVVSVKKESRAVDELSIRYSEISDEESLIPDYVLGLDLASVDSFVVYGYISVVVKSTTSLDQLAMEYYGDSSLQELIAVYNEIDDFSTINVGDTIKVPILVGGSIASKNFVFSTILIDVYGGDIKLDTIGNMIVGESGDYLSIEGPENLMQALNLRLNEALGERLRLIAYGLKSVVGFPASNTASVAYILANLKDTVMQDPRIQEISNIRLKGNGDRLEVSFDCFTIKMGDVIPFTGGI